MAVELFSYQKELASRVVERLNQHNLAYLSAEERVGKTFVALECIRLLAYKNVLIISKKRALPDFEGSINKFFEGLEFKPDITLINYESLHKVSKASKFDFVIIDEAHHALSSYPKPSKSAKLVQSLVYDVPALFMSATPCGQSRAQLFHQLNVSKFSPFDKYKNFYEWFREFGIPRLVWVSGRQVMKYDDIREDLLLPVFERYFVSFSREQAGFEFAPTDKLHYVEVPEQVERVYKALEKDDILYLPNNRTYTPDSITKQLKLLHQLEGGSVKLDDGEVVYLGDEFNFKIDYIKKTFGDVASLVIFYEYIAEGELLRNNFQNAVILQGTSFAEGIDLSHMETLVIYSQNFSSSKYTQRRARQCNKFRSKEIEVHFLLCKGFISDLVYDCVANKHKNFTSSIYERRFE